MDIDAFFAQAFDAKDDGRSDSSLDFFDCRARRDATRKIGRSSLPQPSR